MQCYKLLWFDGKLLLISQVGVAPCNEGLFFANTLDIYRLDASVQFYCCFFTIQFTRYVTSAHRFQWERSLDLFRVCCSEQSFI